MSEDSKAIFKCTLKSCSKYFSTLEDRSSHVWSEHYEKIECPRENCNAMVKKCFMQSHIRKSHKETLKQCDMCGKQMMRASLYKHVLRCQNDGSTEFKCEAPNCGKAFKTESNLADHQRFVHDKPIKCHYDGCNSIMKKCHLKTHIRDVHEKVKSECEKCGKKIGLQSMKIHHERFHNDKPPELVPCPECPKSFNSKTARTAHMRNVHSKPVLCIFPGCGATFKKGQRSKHVRQMHSNADISCYNCGNKVESANLWRHELTCKLTRSSGS